MALRSGEFLTLLFQTCLCGLEAFLIVFGLLLIFLSLNDGILRRVMYLFVFLVPVLGCRLVGIPRIILDVPSCYIEASFQSLAYIGLVPKGVDDLLDLLYRLQFLFLGCRVGEVLEGFLDDLADGVLHVFVDFIVVLAVDSRTRAISDLMGYLDDACGVVCGLDRFRHAEHLFILFISAVVEPFVLDARFSNLVYDVIISICLCVTHICSPFS